MRRSEAKPALIARLIEETRIPRRGRNNVNSIKKRICEYFAGDLIGGCGNCSRVRDPQGRRNASRIRGYPVEAIAQLVERRRIRQTNDDLVAVFLTRASPLGLEPSLHAFRSHCGGNAMTLQSHLFQRLLPQTGLG
jgi:hypothetical protein